LLIVRCYFFTLPLIINCDRARSHLEIAYGLADPDLVEKVGELQKRIKDLEEENKKVKQDLKNAQDELEDLR
jgi:hypothetical protein